MKANILIVFLAGLALTGMSLRAEEPKPEMKCACMKDHEAKKLDMQAQMAAKMKAEAVEFDKLVDEMNASTGEKKMEVMAAVLNKMVQKHKAMHEKMAASLPSDAPKPPAAGAPSPEAPKTDDPHAGHH